MKYQIKLESQGVTYSYSALELLAALVVLDEEGTEITRCNDCILFYSESKSGQEFSLEDTRDFLKRGTFRRRFSLDVDPLEDGTIASTLKDQSEVKLEDYEIRSILNAMNKELKNLTGTFTKLFFDSVITQL